MRLGELSNYQYQTAGAGASFIPSWGQQTFGHQGNEDHNIWGTNKVGGAEGTSSVNGGINTAQVEGAHRPVEGMGLAERIGQHDTIKSPVMQDEYRANKLDLFA